MLIVALIGLSSCSDVDLNIDQEQTEEPLRFIEYVLFPTAPYLDKSYIEITVPEEELAVGHIDFEAEKQAIQQVYSAFITAYVEEDMRALREILDISTGIEWGTDITGNVYGWNNVKTYIEINWSISHCRSGRTKGLMEDWVLADYNWVLTDFYIRPENVKAPWPEASATGHMFYYHPDMPLELEACYVEISRFYFTKKSGKWRIHQIDGSKYFTDDKYKAP